MVIEARYEDGVFKPLGKVKIEEGTVVEIHVDAKTTPRKVKSIGDVGFAGMWADRTDIQDGVTYVNALRKVRLHKT
ncbi:MAG: antitoxin family protein [Pyrinomonadaceae bacterium]